MGTEKQERHGHSHHHRSADDRPASTDVADVISPEKGAHDASAHQRKEASKEPVDERYGEGAKADGQGRIIRVSVVGDRTQILIGLGHDQGVRAGMEGYIKAGDSGLLAEFQIESTTERTATATVDATPQAISESPYVVINPTSVPAAGKDLKGRVIVNSIEGGLVKLTIGLGAKNGVRVGMHGFMHSGDGKPYQDITITQVTARTAVALVNLPNLDIVHRNSEIVLNATTSAGGKQPAHG